MRDGTAAVGAVGGYCGCVIAILLINVLLGGFCFDYCLWAYLGKSAPFWACALCGLVLGEVVIPAAIVAKILTLAGMTVPLFG